LTDSQGGADDGGAPAIPSALRYDAYGNRSQYAGTDGDAATRYLYTGAAGYETDADDIGLQYLSQRYYDPQIGRFITRDPIGWAGGTNLYGYCDNDPVEMVDPSGLAPYAQRFGEVDDGATGYSRQGGTPPVPSTKDAWIFVGDYEMGPLGILTPMGWWGSRNDVRRIEMKFSDYNVHVKWNATKADVLTALRNPKVRAMAFIGHCAYAGAMEVFKPKSSNDEADTFVNSKDCSDVLKGRTLEWAILHVCYSDDPDLKKALVGSKGKWEASCGLWNPVLRTDFGSKHNWIPKSGPGGH
jgi:RHS repeat-associated protein